MSATNRLTNKPLWFVAQLGKTVGLGFVIVGYPGIGATLMFVGWYVLAYHAYREIWLMQREVETYYRCLDRATALWQERNPDSHIDIPSGSRALMAALDRIAESEGL